MAVVARILGVSAFTSVAVSGVGLVLLRAAVSSATPGSEFIIPVFFLACVGGMIGAVAGAAREIVGAQRRKDAKWADIE
jgi:hypothetical protein